MNDPEPDVQSAFDAYRDAVGARDAIAFMRLYADDVRVFDTWGAWSYEGAPAWRKTVEQWFGSLGDERVAVSFDDVRTAGDAATAIVSAIVTYAGVSAAGEKLRSMQNRLTWALRREGEGWLVVHEHTSAPISFDESTAILHRES